MANQVNFPRPFCGPKIYSQNEERCVDLAARKIEIVVSLFESNSRAKGAHT